MAAEIDEPLQLPAGIGGIDLYEWQFDALDVWESKEYRGVIEAVTGTGKTRVGIAAANRALQSGYRVLILVPTVELLNQWVNVWRDHLPRIPIGRIGGGFHDRQEDYRVIVATVHSAARILRDNPDLLIGEHRHGLLIADECHRYAAETFSHALHERYSWRLGLTATYTRDDGAHVEKLDPYFGGVIFRLWFDRALDEDLIAPFHIALIGVPLNVSEQREYDELTDEIRVRGRELRNRLRAQKLPHPQFMALIHSLASMQDYSQEVIAARRYIKLIANRQTLLAETKSKLHALALLHPAIADSRASLIFTQTQSSARDIADLAQSLGVNARAMYSSLETDERKAALQQFKSGDVSALAAPRILDEGIDVPEADLGIVIATHKSKRQLVQRLGRVVRKKPNGRHARFVLFYAIGTIEDPAGGNDAHLTEIVSFAQESVDLPIEEIDEILEFLQMPLVPVAKFPGTAIAPSASVPTTIELTPRTPQPAHPLKGTDPARMQPDHAEQPATGPTRDDIEAWTFSDAEDKWEEALTTYGATADPVKDYLKVISKHPLLKAKQEVTLGRKIEIGLFAQERIDNNVPQTRIELRELRQLAKEGMDAYRIFINSNLRLVVSIARRYSGKSGTLKFLDLIQEGNLGLIRAVQKFDFHAGVKFSTYATWWIRQAITRAIGDHSRTIRVPIYAHEKILKVNNAQRTLAAENNEQTLDSIAKITEFTKAEVSQLISWDRAPIPLSTVIWQSEFSTLSPIPIEEVIVDEFDQSLELVEVQDLYRQLNEAVIALSEREQRVIERRFGLIDGEYATLDQIGKELGVTRERIRQIEKIALTHLHDNKQIQELARELIGYSGVIEQPEETPKPPKINTKVKKRSHVAKAHATTTQPKISARMSDHPITREGATLSSILKDLTY